MSEIWMFTAPAEKGKASAIAKFYREHDGKRYQIGLEKGRKGYRHLQGRLEWSADSTIMVPIGMKKNGDIKTQKSSIFFEQCKTNGIHAEKSEQWCDYEGKDGFYISSQDTPEVRAQRFGKPNHTQEDVLGLTEWTNDREVMVWYDSKGNVGKTWLTGFLWESGKAHYIRMTGTNAESMIKDTASKMSKQRRPIVVIDIPRATKWKPDIYEAIEIIKDGLIDDPRYTSQALNIRGVKVLVMCNTKPSMDKLSADRWIVYGENLPNALKARL